MPRPRSATDPGTGRPGSRIEASPTERSVLVALAARRDRYGRWSTALLARIGGATQVEAAAESGLSERQVRAWEAAFAARRLAIFPPGVLATTQPPAAAATTEPPAPRSTAAPDPPPPRPARSPRTHARDGSRRPGTARGEATDPDRLGLDDTLAAAVRKAVHRHGGRLERHEAGVIQGEDPEEVHDMRVATRRMRAVLGICGPYVDARAVAGIGRGLRRLARRLGAVRDLDVYGLRQAAYLATRDEGERADLKPLLDAWHARREHAREQLLAFLADARYASLKHELTALAADPTGAEPPPFDDGEPQPRRVRHLATALVHDRLAAVRAYEEWLPARADGQPAPLEHYHRLRITGKRLRYVLEVFAEVLGPEVESLLADLKLLQDHLGELQDAVVACNLLRDFLVWGGLGKHPAALPAAPLVAPAVAAYLAHEQAELRRLLLGFPEVWPRVAGGDFRARLNAALQPLST